MDTNRLRQDFPLLREEENKRAIYFDNACQTLRPDSVIKAVNDYYEKYPACAGRSFHKLSNLVSVKCEEARQTIAKFITAQKKEEIIFTRNTTEGINIIAKTLKLEAGDIVLGSDKEHNSNLVPWLYLSRKEGVIHKITPSKEDNTFDLDKFKEILAESDGKVKLVSLVFTSNLDGVSIPAKEIITIAHEYGAKVLLDAAQSIAHQKINVKELDVDFLVFSGHKMLGPSGTGILYGKYKLLEDLEPLFLGGDTVEYSTYNDYKLFSPPRKFEAGLQNYAGILGLAEAAKYLDKVGFKYIIEQEYKLNKYISTELEKIEKLKIIGPTNPALRGGIISFYIKDVDSHQVAIILDESANVMLRSGQHCVHSWFKAHNVLNSIRVSLYFYNTLAEAEKFIDSLKKIIKLL